MEDGCVRREKRGQIRQSRRQGRGQKEVQDCKTEQIETDACWVSEKEHLDTFRTLLRTLISDKWTRSVKGLN